jgi:hypothetical protein
MQPELAQADDPISELQGSCVRRRRGIGRSGTEREGQDCREGNSREQRGKYAFPSSISSADFSHLADSLCFESRHQNRYIIGASPGVEIQLAIATGFLTYIFSAAMSGLGPRS